MIKVSVGILFSLFFVLPLLAQQKIIKPIETNSKISYTSQKHNGYIRCATMQADSIRRANDPSLGAFENNIQFIQQKIEDHKSKHDNQQKLPVLVIPVVIHVIHNGDALGTGENILDGQAISQIQVMNEDFRRILGTPGYNTHADGADVEIEFCMAVVDPLGNVTNGVDHVNYGQATFNSMADIDGNLKPATQWDPLQYMNMWTMRFGGGMAGTLGYAQFPSNSGLTGLAANGGNADSDGVVASYDAMGSESIFTTAQGGIYNATYNLGRTMTHEVGHWLGLRHIWGDGGCTVDDFCTDTPESDASNFGCPSGHTSCSTVDMIENYMDYTDDACMNIFTEDQKTRMRQVMLNSPRRMELSSSTKCTSPNADDAGISAVVSPIGTICGSTSVDPVVTLNNYGNNNVTTVDIVYDIDGGTSFTFTWTGTLAPNASINVTLPNMTVAAGTHTFNASTNLPNGVVDANTANDNSSSSFTISLGNSVDLAITTDCWGYETYWVLNDATNTTIYSGGNTGTTIPPGGGQGAASTDAGAYPNQTALSGNLCLADGCYDFIIYDDWGDGIEGILAGCATAGSYSLTEVSTSTVLASGSTFTNSETTNFCLGSSCTSDAGTMGTIPLNICGTGSQTATHNSDETNDGDDAIQYVLHDNNGMALGTVTTISSSPTFSFVGGMNYGTTYYISAIVGDDLGAGVVDQSDACLSVSAGTPVVWNDLPTVTANSTLPSVCSGSPITLTGGGAVSYTWTNSVTNGTAFNPATTQTYTVTGTDANSCTNTDNVTVTVNSLPTVTANSTLPSVCSGSPITLTGGGAVSYTWTNSVTNGTAFNPATTQTYTVTGTDANSCTNTDNVTVTVNSLPTVTANSTLPSVCSGSPITLTGGGAVSYTWTNSVTNGTAFNPTTTQTYTVTGTDANSCTNTDDVTVTVNSLPTVTANSTLPSVCSGSPITLTGGGAVSYTWTNSVTNGTAFNPTTTQTYTVTGTDANSCTNTDDVTVTVTSLPTVTANSTLPSVCSGSPITLTGGGAVSYTWTNSVTNGTAFNPTTTQTYTVTGTDANSCTNTDDVTVTVTSLPTVTANSTLPSVCSGSPITLTGGGAVSYTWTNSVTNGTAFNPATTQTYTVTGTDANSCTNTDDVTVTVNSLPTVTANSTLPSVCSGSPITLTGGGAVSYTWTNSVTNGTAFNPTTTQTYTVTGTDANSCTNTDNVTVTVTSLPIISNISESCNGTNTAYTVSFDISGGAGGYIISGQPGTLTGATWVSDPIVSGNSYSITVTDANGCSPTIVSGVNSCSCTTDSGTMNTTVLSLCGTSSQTAIHNGDDTLDGNDALQYVLHSGSGTSIGTVEAISSSPTFSFVGGMSYGTTYYVSAIVGDDLGMGVVDQSDACLSVSAGTPVVWNDLPTVTANSTLPSVCSGSPITLTGGGAVSYTWTNSVTNGTTFNPTTTQTYTVTGTDANSCTNTDNVTVTVNSLPTVTANSTLPSVCSGSPITLTGGGAVSYTWTNSVTNGTTFNPTTTQTYTVTGTDANSCTNTDDVTVTVNGLPTVTANSTLPSVCSGSPITLTGGGAVSYTWTNSVTNGTAFNPTTTQTYTVTGTDVNSCTNTDDVTVTVNSLPTVTANSTLPSVCSGSPITLTGGGAVSYTWTNSVTNGTAFNPTTTQTYTVTGTDANSCTNTDNVTVTVNSLPTVTANSTLPSVCSGSPITLTGGGAVSYTWTNSVTNGTAFNPTTTQTYTVTGMDANSCTNTADVTVTVNSLPTVTANSTLPSVCSGSPITLTGGGAVSYTWTNSVTNGTAFNPTTTQTYTVTGTDVNSCTNTADVTVTVNPSPTFSINTMDPTTCGGSDGVITLTGLQNTTSYLVTYTDGIAVGPNSLTSNGSGEIQISGLVVGNYSTFIVELNSCSFTDNATYSLNDPAAFTISTNNTDESCGSGNGEIEIITTGGAGNFQYSTDGVTFVSSNIFTGLSSGIFDISVIDDNNCQTNSQVTIIDVAGPTINSISTIDVSCFGGDTGSLTIDASGNSTLNYVNNGGTSQLTNVFSSLSVGNYSVLVTDDNGCFVTESVSISQPTELTNSTITVNPTCGSDNGSIELTITGGVAPYNTSWVQSTMTSSTLIELEGGVYDYVISDDNGCSINGTETLEGSSSLEFEIEQENESCVGEQDGSAHVINVTGGNPNYSYEWSNGDENAKISNLSPDVYLVTVTDVNGCFETKTVVISSESDECLNIHNAISPNNDGENDTWVINGIHGYPDASVKIFNRWGSLVYESTEYQNDWKGTYDGKDLPAGVYYYIVQLSDEESYEGSLTILR